MEPRHEMWSKFVLQHTYFSRCPKCNELVSQLSNPDNRKAPLFFICWNCKTVAQAHIGPCAELL